MTNASVPPRLSRDADARMRAALNRKSSIATHSIPVISVRNQQFMGARILAVGAFALEGLTKVINLVGALSPGNLSTYEAGNMLATACPFRMAAI